MIVCIDPGHGMGNRKIGVYDPGAAYFGVEEASVVLDYAHALAMECQRRGWVSCMTRTDSKRDVPLGSRVNFARIAHADCLVSLHCNAADRAQARGTETLYATSQAFAQAIHLRLIPAIGLLDRGLKQRVDLAVLKFERAAALIELGFLSNDADRKHLLEDGLPDKVAAAIADGIEAELG